MGYELDGLVVDPRVVFLKDGKFVELSQIFTPTQILVKIKAQIHTVQFKITGKQDGADVFPKITSNAITQQEYSPDNKTLTLYVKTGGDAYSILYTYFGYKLINNTIYVKDPLVENVGSTNTTTFYNGGLDNIVKDEEVVIEVEIVKFLVTFELGYEGGGTFQAVVGYNQTDFEPSVPTTFSSPTRPKYVFQGYNTISDFSGETYKFNAQGIYSIIYQNGVAVESPGFKGVANPTPSTVVGVDYECTLYGEWALETHEIKVVYVPEFAINPDEIVYTDMFPNIIGRHLIRNGASVVGVAYEPDAQVVINSPSTLEGFNYYGWSYRANLTNKSDINVGMYSEIMGEEDVLVYLYYTLDVDAVTNGGGTATISDNRVLYGEVATISCSVNPGYDFGYWMQNSTEIPDSQLTMQVTVVAPTTYYAVFIGKPVVVNLQSNEFAKLRISAETVKDVYRVGDIIKLEIYDLTYGYMRVSWNGEYSGQVDAEGYYTITAEDQIRDHVTFSMDMEARKLNIQFVVEDGVGGSFAFGGQELINVTKEFTYDQMLSYAVTVQQRYEVVKVSLNDVEISSTVTDVLMNVSNGFTVDDINVLKVKFRQMLWVEVWEMFTGQGTQSDPYVIKNESQLAAMAYLINNNIDSEGTIPYAQGYYIVKRNMNLSERFWQPIGTKENPFDGTFDLSDYRVDGLLLDKAYTVIHLDGLFGYITENAQLITKAKNFTVAITIISIVSGVVVATLGVVLYVVIKKRKRMKKLQLNTSISTENIRRIEDDD